MAKQLGSTSFQTVTLAELTSLVGGNQQIGVKVSKSWLKSVSEVFGTVATVETAAVAADEGKSGVTVSDE